MSDVLRQSNRDCGVDCASMQLHFAIRWTRFSTARYDVETAARCAIANVEDELQDTAIALRVATPADTFAQQEQLETMPRRVSQLNFRLSLAHHPASPIRIQIEQEHRRRFKTRAE